MSFINHNDTFDYKRINNKKRNVNNHHNAKNSDESVF